MEIVGNYDRSMKTFTIEMKIVFFFTGRITHFQSTVSSVCFIMGTFRYFIFMLLCLADSYIIDGTPLIILVTQKFRISLGGNK